MAVGDWKCSRAEGCVCGGDLPAIRAGCGWFEGVVAVGEEIETRFWSIVDRDGLTGLPSDMWDALERLVSRASHATFNSTNVLLAGDAIQRAWDEYPFGLPPIILTRAERDALATAALSSFVPLGED